MSTRELIQQELEGLPEALQREVYDFAQFLRSKSDGESFNGLLASETVLARDWETPEEDAAWGKPTSSELTMIIHAVYENGVFRPTDPVTLPERCAVALVVHQESAANSQADNAAPLAKLAAIAGTHPENPTIPSDLAAQHDHYLYGTPKR